MTILSGHGPASPASVSTSIAARMIASDHRYGRARPSTRRAMPADDVFGSDIADITRVLWSDAGRARDPRAARWRIVPRGAGGQPRARPLARLRSPARR